MNRWLRGQKGFLLVSSYMVLSSLMTLSLALWMRGVGLINEYERAMYQTEAFHLAESGLDVAIANLQNDLSYSGASSVPYIQNGELVGTFSVIVETPDNMNPFRKRVISTGLTPDLDGAGRGAMERTIESFVELIPPKTFDFAVFAKQSITMSGSQQVIVDSYDSLMGPYHSSTARESADVMTNSTGTGAITLSGNVNVKGDVRVGEGGDPSTGIVMGSNASISGTTSAATSNKDYESVDVPKSAVPMGDVQLAGQQTLVLEGGVYVFDSIDMTGRSSIEFTGPATVYLTGDAYIAGNGIATPSDYPRNLMIHVAGDHTLTYAGNGALHAGVYAPDAHVDISGDGGVYGGVVANSLYLHGGGHFHYDEDLRRQSNDRFRVEMVSWRELNKYLG